MALADYRLCDVCEGKVFYDAELNYENEVDGVFIKQGEYVPGEWYKLDRLGDWKVLCNECAKTHRCVIEEIKDHL